MTKILPWLLVACVAVVVATPAINEIRPVSNKPGRFLSLPVPQKCSQRPYGRGGKRLTDQCGNHTVQNRHHDLVIPHERRRDRNGPKEFNWRGHNYFFSGNQNAYRGRKYDWLDARNICREYCMDLVSIETQEENTLFYNLIQRGDVPYIWTSGRLCDFKGCENRRDLEPKNVFGWFWSGTRSKMAPTNQKPSNYNFNPWSQTGHNKRPQPDNAEFDINGTNESCMAILNNVYNDGLQWHDVACYHEKPFICEDSDELLNYVAGTNRGIRL